MKQIHKKLYCHGLIQPLTESSICPSQNILILKFVTIINDFVTDVFAGERRRKRRPGAISAPCGAPTEPPSVSAFGNAPSLTSFGLSPSVGATWLHILDAPFRLHAAARLGPRCFRRDCAAAFRLHSAARVFPPPARRRFAGPRATRRHGPAPFLPPSRLSPPRAVI